MKDLMRPKSEGAPIAVLSRELFLRVKPHEKIE